MGFATGNVWSRAARRKRELSQSQSSLSTGIENLEVKSDEDEVEPALGFKITLQAANEGRSVVVKLRWLQGKDSVLFESFCGMLKRQLNE